MSNENTEWENFENKYGLIGLGIGGLALTAFLGPQALTAVTILGGLGAYAFFPDELEKWFNTHQGVLLGSLCGYMCASSIPIIGGPIGLAIGGLIGKKMHDAYNAVTYTANKVVDVVTPIVHPVQTVKNALGGLFKGIANEASYVWNHYLDEKDEDEENLTRHDPHQAEKPQEITANYLAPAPAPMLAPTNAIVVNKTKAIEVQTLSAMLPHFPDLRLLKTLPCLQAEKLPAANTQADPHKPSTDSPAATQDSAKSIVSYSPSPSMLPRYKEQQRQAKNDAASLPWYLKACRIMSTMHKRSPRTII